MESAWESAQLALITLLTVMVFGLGWVTVELDRFSQPERTGAVTGYDLDSRETGWRSGP